MKSKLESDITLTDRAQLNVDDVIRFLNFVISNSFLMYNNPTYKQTHGLAMGSPLSAIVANLFMEVMEEKAILKAQTPT